MFDFTLDKNEKEKLIERGYETTKKYFLETLPQKKKVVLETYKKLLLNLNILSNSIKSNNARDSIFVTNEILSSFIDDSKYIDSSICEYLKNFKESLIINIKKKFMFNKVIENQKQAEETVNHIKMLVQERIEEINFYIKKYNK